MPNQRVRHTRRHAYNTRSNIVKKVRTPGNRLVIQYQNKRVNAQKCGDCKLDLQGIPRYTASQRARLPTRKLTVRRAHGGHLCATCTRQRIIRAFLIEEQKIVKHVLRQGKNTPKEKVEVVDDKKPKKAPRKQLGPKPEAGKKATKKGTVTTKGAATKGTTKPTTTTTKAKPTTATKKATTKTAAK